MRCGASPSNRVANRPTAKPPASKSVFINCPFDDGFKPILRAMVFTIISSGHHPRCALDATDGAEVRVSKIAKMIGECDWGIHDLSRIELDPGAGVPRFNMPMELGLHLGARLFGRGRHRRKRALILEADPHRYDAAPNHRSLALRLLPTTIESFRRKSTRSSPHGVLIRWTNSPTATFCSQCAIGSRHVPAYHHNDTLNARAGVRSCSLLAAR